MKARNEIKTALMIVSLLAALTAFAGAQVTAGAVIAGGGEGVSLYNLQSEVSIPLMERPSATMPFHMPPINVGNVNWVPVSGQWQPQSSQNGNPSSLVGSLSYAEQYEDCWSTSDQTYYYYYVYSGFSYTGPDGNVHDVGDPSSIELYNYPADCDNQPYYNPIQDTGYTLDSSGYIFDLQVDPNYGTLGYWISTADGRSFSTLDDTGSYEQIADANSNKIKATYNSQSQGWTYTDTLNQTPMTETPTGYGEVYNYTSPGGQQESIQVFNTVYTLQTNFGCSGVAEFSQSNYTLPGIVEMPDGTEYQFTWETPSGYSSSYTTGRLASVTLPTGAVIHYTYPGANDGIDCTNGDTESLTRQTPDGTATYTRSVSTDGSGYKVTQVNYLSPANQLSVFRFDGSTPISQDTYADSTTNNDLLSVSYTYDGQPADWASPDWSQRTAVVTLPNGQRRQRYTKRDYLAGGVVEDDIGDWGTSGSGGPWLRKVLTTDPALPAEIEVEDGNGNQVADTKFNRDNHGNVTSAVCATGTGTLTRSFRYNTNGTVATATGFNGGTTTFEYYACNSGRLTNVYGALSGLDLTIQPDCGGTTLAETDQNDVTTRVTGWDPYFFRPTQITNETTNDVTNFTYGTTAGGWSVERAMIFNSGSSTSDTLTTYDGMGRPVLVQRRQAPGSSEFDSVETQYDADGRPYRVSMPYTGTAGQLNGSVWTTTTYDNLGRPLIVADGGGGVTTYAYSGNDVEVTKSGGGQSFSRQLEYDGLNRLTSVCEMQTTSLNPSGGTCGQTNAVTGYWTKYVYNALGKITNVTQNAQGSPQQTRTFAYDELGRVTSETTPEAGTTSLSYDLATSHCNASNGDLVQRTDAAGNVTCYEYDALHRVTEVSYPVVASGQGYAFVDPRYFVYDAATVDGVAMTNVEGRLAEAYTMSCCQKINDEGYSYDATGRPTDLYERGWFTGDWYHVSESYYANGTPATLTIPGLASPVSYAVDAEGRPATAAVGSTTLVSGTAYGDDGAGGQLQPATPDAPTAVTFGSGDADTYLYDQSTGRMQSYTFSVNGATDTGTLGWNANGTLGQLAIDDQLPGAADNQTCTYSYDDLARLSGANCGAAQNQTFAYDAFGNMATAANPGTSFSASFDVSNQIADVGNCQPHYNADGDLLDDPTTCATNVNQFNVENQPVQLDNVYIEHYDALGRMTAAANGVWKEMLYAPDGRRVATMQSGSPYEIDVPLPAGGMAVYQGSTPTLAYYTHMDWQGSARLATTPSRSLYASGAYAPFGNAYATSGAFTADFTGQTQPTGANNYDFPMRDYNPVQSRWWTPDPAGLAAVDPANPQSWNAYAYVNGQPLTSIDPTGLDPCPDGTPAENNGVFIFCANFLPPGTDQQATHVPYDPDLTYDWAYFKYLDTSLLPPTYPITNPGTLPGPFHVGPEPHAPNNGTNLGKILKCASKTANQFSIAGIMGITESHSVGATIGTAFLGNTFSGIVDTGTHVLTGHFGAAYGDVALGGYAQGLALGPNAPVAAQGVVGVVTNAGVDAALGEGMAGPVGWAKLGIDAATFLGSALYCASN